MVNDIEIKVPTSGLPPLYSIKRHHMWLRKLDSTCSTYTLDVFFLCYAEELDQTLTSINFLCVPNS